MTAVELAQSAATDPRPPGGLSDSVRALWLAKVGRWDEAHDLCQEDVDKKAGAWVHAWLHRQEGDFGNAAYWYARADQPTPGDREDLDAEWMAIADALLDK